MAVVDRLLLDPGNKPRGDRGMGGAIRCGADQEIQFR